MVNPLEAAMLSSFKNCRNTCRNTPRGLNLSRLFMNLAFWFTESVVKKQVLHREKDIGHRLINAHIDRFDLQLCSLEG